MSNLKNDFKYDAFRIQLVPLRPGQRMDESEWENLPTFMLHTLRRRITSSAKKKRDPTNMNLAQTPDGSFLDLLKNASDLLDRCGVSHPEPEARSSIWSHPFGPSVHSLVHSLVHWSIHWSTHDSTRQ